MFVLYKSLCLSFKIISLEDLEQVNPSNIAGGKDNGKTSLEKEFGHFL